MPPPSDISMDSLNDGYINFNIDLEKSWIIGDSENDILAGKNAKCNTAYINAKDINENIDYNICGRDLLECVNKILEKEK